MFTIREDQRYGWDSGGVLLPGPVTLQRDHLGHLLEKPRTTLKVPPEAGPDECILWNGTEWVVTPDAWKLTRYSKVDGHQVYAPSHDYIFDDSVTDIPRPSIYHFWDDVKGGWSIDPARYDLNGEILARSVTEIQIRSESLLAKYPQVVRDSFSTRISEAKTILASATPEIAADDPDLLLYQKVFQKNPAALPADVVAEAGAVMFKASEFMRALTALEAVQEALLAHVVTLTADQKWDLLQVDNFRTLWDTLAGG